MTGSTLLFQRPVRLVRIESSQHSVGAVAAADFIHPSARDQRDSLLEPMASCWRFRGSRLWAALSCVTLMAVAVPLDSDEQQSLAASLEADGVPLLPDEVVDYVNDNPVIEVDEGEQRVEIDDSGSSPVCPPAVRPFNKQLCRVKVCRRDRDCGRGFNSNRACCFNGCVRTCQTKLASPPLFDWDEEGNGKPLLQDVVMSKMWAGAVTERRGPAEFQQSKIVVTLPGNCRLTQQQFETFKLFKSSPNIRNCFCRAGDVLCQVFESPNQTNSSETPIPIKVF